MGNIIGVLVREAHNNITPIIRIDMLGSRLCGNEYEYLGDYYKNHKAFNIEDVIISDNHMCKIPVFWYKRENILNTDYKKEEAWWIADYPEDGFTRHPAFMNDGKEIDCFYIGKYQSSLNGNTYSSMPKRMPLTSLSIKQTKQMACSLGDNWGIWDIYQLSAIQMLALIETASTDSQRVLGRGNVQISKIMHVLNVDDDIVKQASYRGITGLWGNINQYIDGIKSVFGELVIWDRFGHRNWKPTNVLKPSHLMSNIYPTYTESKYGFFYNFKDLFIPKSIPIETNPYIYNSVLNFMDIDEIQVDEFFCTVGGSLNNRLASLWQLSNNISENRSYRNTGSRLSFVGEI